MKNKWMKKVLTIALAAAVMLAMAPVGMGTAHAATADSVNKQIEALPAVKDADLGDFTKIMKANKAYDSLDDPTDVKDANSDKIHKLTYKMIEQKNKIEKSKVKITKIKVGKKKATITWKKAPKTGVKYTYEVYRATKKNGKYKKVATTKSTKKVVKNLKKGKTYYFKVKAIAKVKDEDDKTVKFKSNFKKTTPKKSKKIK